jgi:TetR/AcrR family transcriptional repressor of mexJK operon
LAKAEITKASPGRIPSHKLAQHEDAFLDAASALFNEHGLARVSIDMIARAARVSTKTIYARYGGKLGLFSAVIRKQIAPILATQDAFLSPQNEDPIKLLRNVAAAFVERLLDPNVISLHRMMIAEAAHMPELSELYYREIYERAQNRLADWLSKQDAAGIFKIPTPKRAAEIFAALVGAGMIDRAHLLNVVPSATERTEQIDNAISVFSRAYEIRQHPKG